jgi:hypothetical protein
MRTIQGMKRIHGEAVYGFHPEGYVLPGDSDQLERAVRLLSLLLLASLRLPTLPYPLLPILLTPYVSLDPQIQSMSSSKKQLPLWIMKVTPPPPSPSASRAL